MLSRRHVAIVHSQHPQIEQRSFVARVKLQQVFQTFSGLSSAPLSDLDIDFILGRLRFTVLRRQISVFL